MKKLKLLMVLIIFLAGCAELPEPGNYYVIPADENMTPDYTFCDGEQCWSVAYVNSTPIPTNTPFPTTFPTPTVEPVITPSPTFPPVETCELKAGASNLRIREDAGTQYDPSASSPWSAGSISTFNTFKYDDTKTYLWGQHVSGGWSAVYITSGTWLVFGTGQTVTCQDVEGWPQELEPPSPIVIREVLHGPHCLFGQGCSSALTYFNSMMYPNGWTVFKTLEGTFGYNDFVHAQNAPTICRIFVDRPSQSDYDNPEQFYQKITGRFPDTCDYVEIENEHYGPTQGFEYWSQWSIEMAKLFNSRRNMAVLAFSFGPGNPDYPNMPKMVDYMLWADENPLPDGRYNGIASHASAFMINPPGFAPWVNSIHHTTERWTALGRDVIYANTGYDINLRKWVLAFTEVGISDGYGGPLTWSQGLWNCNDYANAYKTTIERTDADIIIFWSWGDIGNWDDLSKCSSSIWN